MKGRLRTFNPDEQWVEVVNDDGDQIGYVTDRDAHLLDLQVLEIRPIKRYLDDPYVRYHALLAHERGLFTHGQDVNEVQKAMVASNMRVQQDRERDLHEQRLIESMAINNPPMYKAYMKQREQKQEREAIEEMVQEKVPSSMADFLEALKAFDSASEEDLENDEGYSPFSPDLIEGMQD